MPVTVSLSIDTLPQLPHSRSTLSYCSVEEQEREAGPTRNDYFSLWRAQGYATLTDDATRKHATPSRAFIGRRKRGGLA